MFLVKGTQQTTPYSIQNQRFHFTFFQVLIWKKGCNRIMNLAVVTFMIFLIRVSLPTSALWFYAPAHAPSLPGSLLPRCRHWRSRPWSCVVWIDPFCSHESSWQPLHQELGGLGVLPHFNLDFYHQLSCGTYQNSPFLKGKRTKSDQHYRIGQGSDKKCKAAEESDTQQVRGRCQFPLSTAFVREFMR